MTNMDPLCQEALHMVLRASAQLHVVVVMESSTSDMALGGVWGETG